MGKRILNIEQGILNVEVKPINIQNSLFNIHYSKKIPAFTSRDLYYLRLI